MDIMLGDVVALIALGLSLFNLLKGANIKLENPSKPYKLITHGSDDILLRLVFINRGIDPGILQDIDVPNETQPTIVNHKVKYGHHKENVDKKLPVSIPPFGDYRPFLNLELNKKSINNKILDVDVVYTRTASIFRNREVNTTIKINLGEFI